MSADIFCDSTGKLWTAQIRIGGKLVWEKTGMKSESNAETAMEAKWKRLKRGRHGKV